MIKINLAKASSVVTVDSEVVASGGLASFSQSDNVVKVIVMLVFIFGVYGYENYNLDKKLKTYQTVKVQSDALRAKVQQFSGVMAAVEDLARERKTLREQVKVIQKIAKKRAFKLASITKLQESIPLDTWVEEMRVGSDSMNFKGFARTPVSIQTIVAGLEDLDFMESVVNKEQALKKIGISEVHTFNIEAKVK